MRPMTFWFEFASTYSYLSVMRIDTEAEKHGVEIIWKPFLLGPIFQAQGWETSPFNLYPAKGRNMWRDLERRCEKYGLKLNRPSKDDPRMFPQNGLMAARLAIVGLQQDWGKAFCKSVYLTQFAEGHDISDPDCLKDLLAKLGVEAEVAFAEAQANKHILRTHVEEAKALGIYGAPSFTIERELFWGDDRLEDALEWASTQSS